MQDATPCVVFWYVCALCFYALAVGILSYCLLWWVLCSDEMLHTNVYLSVTQWARVPTPIRIPVDTYLVPGTCLLRLVHLYKAVVVCIHHTRKYCIFSTQQHACRVIQELCTSRQHQNRLYLALTSKPRKISETFGATKIKIEIKIEIASFRQDCRKDQDCHLLGNLSKEMIGTVSGGNLHHWAKHRVAAAAATLCMHQYMAGEYVVPYNILRSIEF